MLNIMRFWAVVFPLIFHFGPVAFGQAVDEAKGNRWVDSVMARLSVDEKIAQLLMVPVKAGNVSPAQLNWINRNHPGAVLITGGDEVACREMLKGLQSESPVPMLAAIQSDWGPGQVLHDALQMPKPMVLAAAGSDSLAFMAGRYVGRKLRDIGIHMSISVNADIDVPKQGSLAAARYYSNDPGVLKRITGAWIRGLKRESILPILKHLPGEKESVYIDVYRSTLNVASDQEDSFRVFRELLNSGADGLLTSWLHYSVKSGVRSEPAPLSGKFISEVIRGTTGPDRLVIGENSFLGQLQGNSKSHVSRTAFALGYDLIIVDNNPAQALEEIRNLLRQDKQLHDDLDNRVRRILKAKFRSVMAAPPESSPATTEDQRHANALAAAIREQAITVIRNSASRLPVKNLTARRFMYVRFGENTYAEGLQMFLNYAPFHEIRVRSIRDTVLLANISPEDVVVTDHTDTDNPSLSALGQWLNRLDRRCSLIVVHYGNPYELLNVRNCTSVVEGYDREETQFFIPQMIFGALPGKGKIPVLAENLPASTIQTAKLGRISFGLPEQSGMSSNALQQIDSIVWSAIEDGATPGARVLAVRRGRVVLDRSYGWHTYEKKEEVNAGTIYDLASVTKVTATLQAVMHLHDQGLVDLEKKASVYLPELKGTNKQDFTLKDILTHQAGLWPFLPFWSRTMKDSVWLPKYYSVEKRSGYELPVSENLFASNVMRDSLWAWILRARISESKEREPFRYKYSDMGFYILQHLTESLLAQPMDEFLERKIYGPIGATTMGYLPLRRFPASSIAPTEDDRLFRKSLLRGYVHDQGAAMHGGVAGHAGLFSTALDLAKMGQMWLQGGSYGGEQYFRPSTVQLFTRRQFQSSRRGLGWDRPTSGSEGPTSASVSSSTFGHTGFTGTCIWVDPVQDLVYVFLSNRVHPDMNNSKLINGNVRPRVQEVLYQAIKAFEVENPSLF